MFQLVFFRKFRQTQASIAQLGERKTEDLEAPCSIHGRSRYDGGIVRMRLRLTPGMMAFPFFVSSVGRARDC